MDRGRRRLPGFVWLGPRSEVSEDDGTVGLAPAVTVPESADEASWLLPRLAPLSASSVTVGAIIPSGYPAYARVLHPARKQRADGTVEPVSWRDVATWSSRVMHPEVQWEALAQPRVAPRTPPPFQDEPFTGHTTVELRQGIADALLPFTTRAAKCWVCVWEGRAGIGDVYPELPRVIHPWRTYMLLQAPLEAVISGVFEGSAADDVSPAFWWPADRSWCVATEIDFKWTYVAGSEEAIEAVLQSAQLEALPAELLHRADYRSDTINGPVRPH